MNDVLLECAAKGRQELTRINLRRIGFLLVVLGAIAGCSTMSADECVTADWRTIGYEDGAAGREVSAISRHRKACAKHGVTAILMRTNRGTAKGCASSAGRPMVTSSAARALPTKASVPRRRKTSLSPPTKMASSVSDWNKTLRTPNAIFAAWTRISNEHTKIWSTWKPT